MRFSLNLANKHKTCEIDDSENLKKYIPKRFEKLD